VEIANMPVHVGSLWPTQKEARSCPRGDIRLSHCTQCQLVFNAAFDPKPLEYTHEYDNSLEASAVFRDFAASLAGDLIERYDLREKTIVEIGCGKGEFIGLLCELGPNNGRGYDTTYDEKSANPAPGRLEFVKAHYTGDQTGEKADLVVSRHVFEHIPDPLAFLKMLRGSLGDDGDTIVYFEVPEVLFILRDLSIWDIVYEHCNYFGHESLGSIFARAGFEIISLENYFDDQFLAIEARPAKPGATLSAVPVSTELRVGARVAAFAEHFASTRDQWNRKLRELKQAGKKVAIWAAGAKTVSFVNLFDVENEIDSIVDINPRKQGFYLPGSGHEILSPDALASNPPDTVILMNSHYRDEIAAQLRSMGLDPELLSAGA
jgi:SAM-dependent methyltransferase